MYPTAKSAILFPNSWKQLCNATQEGKLSDQFAGAQYDYDLQALDNFVKVPSFNDFNSDEEKVKKLKDFKTFVISHCHKQVKLNAAN